MIFLFWAITLIFCVLAVTILLPWLAINLKNIFFLLLIPIFSYIVYYQFGFSEHLVAYYSVEQENNREQMLRVRPLMTELKKQEFRLRFHLEENPKNILAQSQLLELLSIQAMQTGDQNLAKQFLLKAIEVLPHIPIYSQRRKHIQEMLKTNFE